MRILPRPDGGFRSIVDISIRHIPAFFALYDRPGIVDKSVKPILDQTELYSGCYGRASISFYAFNQNGNKGIACGLQNLQKLADGEPLGARSRADEDFTTADDDDFLA